MEDYEHTRVYLHTVGARGFVICSVGPLSLLFVAGGAGRLSHYYISSLIAEFAGSVVCQAPQNGILPVCSGCICESTTTGAALATFSNL